MTIDLFGRSHALEHQHNRPAGCANIDGFVGSIQDKHRGVHRRIASLGELVVRTECSVTLHGRNPQSGLASRVPGQPGVSGKPGVSSKPGLLGWKPAVGLAGTVKRRHPTRCPPDLLPLRRRRRACAASVFIKDESDAETDSGAEKDILSRPCNNDADRISDSSPLAVNDVTSTVSASPTSPP